MKSLVRTQILNKLKSLNSNDKQLHSKSIQNQLKKILQGQSGHWVAFKHLNSEPEIHWNEVSDSIQWAFPKIEKNELSFKQGVTLFTKSSLGFSEPEDGIDLNLAEVQGVVMPALAYDRRGYRLGRGKGFYDRALQSYSGRKIGICFDISLCEELPHEDHDIRCDEIVTENQHYQVSQSEGVRKWN